MGAASDDRGSGKPKMRRGRAPVMEPGPRETSGALAAALNRSDDIGGTRSSPERAAAAGYCPLAPTALLRSAADTGRSDTLTARGSGVGSVRRRAVLAGQTARSCGRSAGAASARQNDTASSMLNSPLSARAIVSTISSTIRRRTDSARTSERSEGS
ncbi:MAG: hypothetical protein JWN32_493 [Solirubrobacterales bacterium]|nr:hypothetical protein [Solirubrobacterales bacterium]